ncbi:unnamed protein product [Nezara viridula]|uniref:Uncharacterized protein n=1 Tax=Nezara viridula TaxID=85310 RepID=A0A9P0HPV1_NEZVI|nr:unnamed protein product [Nezara viridula]
MRTYLLFKGRNGQKEVNLKRIDSVRSVEYNTTLVMWLSVRGVRMCNACLQPSCDKSDERASAGSNDFDRIPFLLSYSQVMTYGSRVSMIGRIVILLTILSTLF